MINLQCYEKLETKKLCFQISCWRLLWIGMCNLTIIASQLFLSKCLRLHPHCQLWLSTTGLAFVKRSLLFPFGCQSCHFREPPALRVSLLGAKGKGKQLNMLKWPQQHDMFKAQHGIQKHGLQRLQLAWLRGLLVPLQLSECEVDAAVLVFAVSCTVVASVLLAALVHVMATVLWWSRGKGAKEWPSGTNGFLAYYLSCVADWLLTCFVCHPGLEFQPWTKAWNSKP